MNISVVIAVNKNDVWFCRICVASIRYYYPVVEIYLLKDELNGRFSTREIEKNWNVQVIEFSQHKFGWSAAKIHFYCDERFAGKNFLVLDADIVFTGKLLDEPFVKNFNADVIVSEEIITDPKSNWFKQTYFDFDAVKSFDPAYVFPGFTFNCGQLFCKGNFLNRKMMIPYFDFNEYPAWKRLDIFPLVDQSLFNYLLPALSTGGELKLARERYMIWSESDLAKKITIELLMNGEAYPKLIHWAGALRTPLISKMSQSEILTFFENHYYRKVGFGILKKKARKTKVFFINILRIVYAHLKKNKKNV